MFKWYSIEIIQIWILHTRTHTRRWHNREAKYGIAKTKKKRNHCGFYTTKKKQREFASSVYQLENSFITFFFSCRIKTLKKIYPNLKSSQLDNRRLNEALWIFFVFFLRIQVSGTHWIEESSRFFFVRECLVLAATPCPWNRKTFL